MAKKRKRKRRRPNPATAAGPGRPSPVAEAESVPAGNASGEAAASPVREGPPPPPWGSFPLSELVIFIGIVLLASGFFIGPPQGTVTLVVGLGLASLGGLELAVREHLAGYRSHTVLIAGAAAIAVLATLLALRAGPAIAAAAAAVVFAISARLLVGVFRRRSGGELYRIK